MRRVIAAILLFTAGASARNAAGPFETTSLLGRKLYALADDGTIKAAERKLAADPKNPELLVALSKAQAGRRQYKEAVATCTRGLAISPNNVDLLLERGHRELGLRDFATARKDLERATQVNPKSLDSFYHLGLANYFQRRFTDAAKAFQSARDLAQNNDSLIDCSNWLYVSLRRANQPDEAKQVLARITPEVQNKEPHLLFYLKLLHFYQGKATEQEIKPPQPTKPGDTEAELSFDTVSYGLGNWQLYNGDAHQARELFQPVVSGEAWNAWGFIGSELELAKK